MTRSLTMRLSQQMRLTARRTRSIDRPVRLTNKPRRRDRGPCIEPLFDSLEAASAGVRSSTHPLRHLVYSAKPYEIDLLLESHPGNNRLMVTGQLLDTDSPTIFPRGVRVTLWNRRHSFVTLRTNEWGEFLGEIEDSGELTVSIRIQKREIVISATVAPFTTLPGRDNRSGGRHATMKHFTTEEWIRFVNHAVSPKESEEMEKHLKQEGCQRCQAVVSMWQRVQESAASEKNYQPPPDTVSIVKAAFGGWQPL